MRALVRRLRKIPRPASRMLPSRFSSRTVRVLSSSRAALACDLVMPTLSAKYTDICACVIYISGLLVGHRIKYYQYREQGSQTVGERGADGEDVSQQRSQQT